MNTKKVIAILVAIIFAFGFNTMYSSTIIFWDAYGYEVSLADTPEPELTIEVTNQELAEYPELAAKLEEVDQDEYAMLLFEEGEAILQYEDLLESKGPDETYDFVYLQTDDQVYMVMFTMYGGMEDMPIYLWLSGLSGLVAVGLVVSEVIPYLRSRK